MIDWIPADSENIKQFAYDPEKQELYVQFHHGDRRYTYFGVSPEKFAALQEADSHGKHFHQNIAGKHMFSSGSPI